MINPREEGAEQHRVNNRVKNGPKINELAWREPREGRGSLERMV
ncbi:hypothetical protein SCARR_05337 [Pontiella sulfatireligans]|uniref:Uncharacterized protein n=1 Tax=Pontiella sulfatireligans TaxID=2750658 RepID=A0A6C2USB8_9BACT|nr:hypothetical protein SCARR_05337 [Pontiella sulfatireligans]